MPWPEVVRLALGLAMPILLMPHIFGTRVLADAFGVDDSYAYVRLLPGPVGSSGYGAMLAGRF